MDVVDIGGAAKGGRPRIPKMQTVVFNDAGVAAVDSNGAVVSDVAAPDARNVVYSDINDPKVMRAMRGSSPAYPDDHPANNADKEQDADGAIILKKGEKLSDGFAVGAKLGDVREGYSKGRVGVVDNVEAKQEVADELDEMLNNMAIEENAKPLASTPVAVDNLVLLIDNRAAAKQRFIPQVVKGEDGTVTPIELIVTGKDKQENVLHVIPLNMQFTVANYDFMVLMLVGGEDQ